MIELGDFPDDNPSSESDASEKDCTFNERLLRKFAKKDLDQMQANLNLEDNEATNIDRLRRGVIYASFPP